ncbi:DeoR/GlpR family DNA-binding transcription regulator [Qaidamihabitans albus]|uniref:DeoR/GlpR family DNA-binding transcription regulator n=1 Tax=Qaidamihabitans albus TaxID=2795733 RepID=UPI0018F131E4|nr:DeoR/GlpR family DNA-binding transcription regulator [Qaidamihabitans albus]
MAAVSEYEREQEVLRRLESSARVTVADLVAAFDVSAVTIRKDLDLLERRGLLRRVRGGAVRADSSDEGAFALRIRHSRREKLAIARAAADLVDDGDVIALDSSTTCYYLATQLTGRQNLVVVTNGLRTAMLLQEQSSATVVLPGGVIRRASSSLVGQIGDVLQGRGTIRKGFFGLRGLSVEHGMLELSEDEASAKRSIARVCRHRYGVFDSTKVDRFGLYPFVGPGDVTALFTDDGVAPETVRTWRELGVDVHVVTAGEEE